MHRRLDRQVKPIGTANKRRKQFPTALPRRHCEERSDEAIPTKRRSAARDRFAALAMADWRPRFDLIGGGFNPG